jgi:hypothetical protein
MRKPAVLVPAQNISDSILTIRGKRVLLDSELAALYGAKTKTLNQAVKRNVNRFSDDFMFRLTKEELTQLNRSQIVTGLQRHRDPRFLPYAFTEHGSIMAATVLNSKRAVEMSIYVVRAFVQLRQLLASNRELARQFIELERRVSTHDQTIVGILKTIRELMSPPKSHPIGFTVDFDKK